MNDDIAQAVFARAEVARFIEGSHGVRGEEARARVRQAAVALCCRIPSLVVAILHPGPWVEGRRGAACASRKRRQAP